MFFHQSSSKVVVLHIDVLVIHFLQRDKKKSAASITCKGVRFGIERARLAKRATVANSNSSKSQPE